MAFRRREPAISSYPFSVDRTTIGWINLYCNRLRQLLNLSGINPTPWLRRIGTDLIKLDLTYLNDLLNEFGDPP